MSTTETDPTMIDVAFAVAESTGNDPGPVPEILNFIMAHQEAERAMHDDWRRAWHAEDRGMRLYMTHAIQVALDACEVGGTTASYEVCLDKVARAVCCTRYNEIVRWYIEQCKENELFDGVHPSFLEGGYA